MFGITKEIKKLLIRKGWYNDIRYSGLFRLYQRFFKRDAVKQHRQEVEFYQSFLPPCELIYDIGAFDGHKTAAFLALGSKVVCCEPDQHNISILQSRFRNSHKRVIIEPVAVSDHIGVETFLIHHAGSAFNTLNPAWKLALETDRGERWEESIEFSKEARQVSTVTLDSLIEKYGRPDFIKIDVEGSENKVLAGLSHKISFISFECLMPDFKTEIQECLSKIQLLDAEARYNVSMKEKLLFADFQSLKQLDEWIGEKGVSYFEIIVKMNV